MDLPLAAMLYVAVTFGAAAPVSCLVDTGAQVTVLGSSVAERAGSAHWLPTPGGFPVIRLTNGALLPVEQRRVHLVRTADLSWRYADVVIIQDEAAALRPDYCVLGYDLLGQQPVIVDPGAGVRRVPYPLSYEQSA